MAPSRERSTHCRAYKRKSIRHSGLAQIADAITQNPCSICLCEIKPSRAALLPLCKHAFCADCIHKWSDYKRTCPLCKAEFGSWLFLINLSSQTLEKEKFKSPLDDRPRTVGFPARRRSHLDELRLIRRTRAELTTQYSRTGVIPRRRSFGQLEAANPGVIRERTLQWRASIYERKLQAVPFSSKNRLIERRTPPEQRQRPTVPSTKSLISPKQAQIAAANAAAGEEEGGENTEKFLRETYGEISAKH
nr:E3 ubiquitin-protein ligase Topors-like isoform X1 [Ipomoea batatas]